MNEHVLVFKHNKDAIVPTRRSPLDGGLDLYAMEDTFLPLGTTTLVDTGIALQIQPGCIGKIEDRSSMAAAGLRTGAGVVDFGFNGPISVVIHNLTNRTNNDAGVLGYWVRKGDRIAQVVIHKVELPQTHEVQELWITDRGNRGFGSSGK